MKNLFLAVISLMLFTQCERNTNDIDQTITSVEKEDLTFMYEEEKLARDTYTYLYEKWQINEFGNIRYSEQSHMNAVENLLIKYNVPYQKLEEGKFANQSLQTLYNQLIAQGSISSAESLMIGATIEDLDIQDLKVRSITTQNTNILKVYNNLTCGSRNHLRAFISALTILGKTYEPQYISQTEFDSIINSPNEQCGK